MLKKINQNIFVTKKNQCFLLDLFLELPPAAWALNSEIFIFWKRFSRSSMFRWRIRSYSDNFGSSTMGAMMIWTFFWNFDPDSSIGAIFSMKSGFFFTDLIFVLAFLRFWVLLWFRSFFALGDKLAYLAFWASLSLAKRRFLSVSVSLDLKKSHKVSILMRTVEKLNLFEILPGNLSLNFPFDSVIICAFSVRSHFFIKGGDLFFKICPCA